LATPTAPIALAGDPSSATARLDDAGRPLGDEVLDRLRGACSEVIVGHGERAEASRDWWPLAMIWALEGQVPALASCVCRPADAGEVAAVLSVCNEARVPVTAAGGRSGVCGASVPVHGGVVLDLTAMAGVTEVDDTSLVVSVLPGTFGHELEAQLRDEHGLTLGHWPQSVELSTVGGWVACRSAGQYSTRYGKIEDMVVGLDVVLADGRTVTTGGMPRQAVGPDLTQLFVGSEGTLGVITGARLRAHPVPPEERRAAHGFDSFADGLDTCRRILRRGATPAVLRLYDEAESKRSYGTEGTNVLLVLDEGEPALLDATMAIVAQECGKAATLDAALVEQWLGHRNDVSALEALIQKGFVVDTMEISAPWSRLDAIYSATTVALQAVPGCLAATAHQSHSYPDGACLYFTFAARPAAEDREATYVELWEAGTRAVLAAGGSLSHHHGVGLHRSRFVREALGDAFEVLTAVKAALDPRGILNPGKLGLTSPFGEVGWPREGAAVKMVP
jgi:alkyldihydroxyacetonephosphate synthase